MQLSKLTARGNELKATPDTDTPITLWLAIGVGEEPAAGKPGCRGNR
jgi:hypothetical protein